MTIPFIDATLASGGGKAANLGELQRAGFPVPDGFVITADTYRNAVADLDLEELLGQGPDAVRAAVEAKTIPDAVAQDITDRLAAWGEDAAVAVRSSATAEDLPEASFAGQQDTFLGVIGADAVLEAVRRCWGSLWTARAVDYRQRNGFDHHDVALAVVVQRLVDADTAGVLFTRDPVTGAEQTLIDASWGLGESVVSGAVTPDEYHTTVSTVLERRLGAKQTRIDRHGITTRITEVPTGDRSRFCLSDAQVLELAHLGQAVHNHYGTGMDLEWAYTGTALWLLQARPITTTASAPAETRQTPTTTVSGRRIGKASRTFHTDLVEHYPGPYPLDLAAIIPMHRQLQAGMASIGITSTPVDQLIAMEEDGTITAAYPDVHLGWRLCRLIGYQAPDPAGWPAVEDSYRSRLAAVLPVNLHEVPDRELLSMLDQVLLIVSDIARTRFLDYVGPAQLSALRLGLYLALARRRDLDAYDLLGDLDYTTVTIDKHLHHLAGLDPDSTAYREARQRFLDRHGARTTQLYLPFSHRSWREDPTSLDATLDAVRRSPQRPADTTPHQDLVDEITRRLPAPARPGFIRALTAWRNGYVAREASVYLIEGAYVTARRVSDEIATRLHQRHALETMEDLKYLTLAEVETALNKPASAPEIRATATKRNIARRQAAPAWWSRDDRPAGETLTGAAGSPGLASGPVRVITGPADFNQLQAGDILVCHYTDPSWTPLFGLAAGVIAETGGRLSHAAIVAREYGIPAVMGAAGATTTLTNGQTITVNGTTGTVTI